MSSVLPFDIITEIIDTVGENKDTNLLKKLALVSHSFLQICSKHLLATVELDDAVPKRHDAFVKLLKNRPDVVKYIRKLTYKVGYQSIQFSNTCRSFNDDDRVLSHITPNFLRTISQLNCLIITTSESTPLTWNSLNSSLTSVFLHLMHLPTINHIDLSIIHDFPLSSLTPSINLHRLDLSQMTCFNSYDGSPGIVVLSEMPKILELHSSDSSLLTKLLHAKTQDGQPAFNCMDLRRLSLSFTFSTDERNIRYLLQNAKLLEKLQLSVRRGRSLVELHDILSPSARTIKVLDLTVILYDGILPLPLAGLCEELEAMTGHNMLVALSFEVDIDGDETEEFIGSVIQKVEKVLVKSGWPMLRQVSFNISIACCRVSRETSVKLSEALQSVPDKYLNHLPKLKSVAFYYSARVVKKCPFKYCLP